MFSLLGGALASCTNPQEFDLGGTQITDIELLVTVPI